MGRLWEILAQWGGKRARGRERSAAARRSRSRRHAFEPLEERSLLSISSWLPEGPSPAFGGQVQASGSVVTGPIQTVAAHPSDANKLVVGAVNGGIWWTEDAAAGSPTWNASYYQQTDFARPASAIARSDATVTVTLANHGLAAGSRVQIAGADQAEYNGVFTVASAATNTFTYTIAGAPATPATGTPMVVPLGAFPSLSIGALEFDPADPTRVLAGVGRYSAVSDARGARAGGDLAGLLVSTDGGRTWASVYGGGTTTMLGKNVSGVALRGTTLVAAVDSAEVGAAGVYRSTDGGQTFSRPAGLPSSGKVFDLVGDPADSQILYAAVGGSGSNGVYKSTDTGATWTRVSDAALNALITNSGVRPAATVELAAGAGGSVFAGIVRGTTAVKPITSITRAGTGGVVATVTLPGHGFSAGNQVQISGANQAEYNGIFTIATIAGDTFTCTVPSSAVTPATGTMTATRVANSIRRVDSTATVTMRGHGFSVGDSVFVSGAVPSTYNGTFTITSVSEDSFSYAVTGTPDGRVTSLTRSGTTATVTLPNHGLSAGATFYMAGADQPEYNGTFTVLGVTGANTFTYALRKQVYSLTRSGTTATVTLPNHGFASGQSITISGAGQAEYNDTFTINVLDANRFSFTVEGAPTTPATGTITAVPPSSTSPATGALTATSGAIKVAIPPRLSALYQSPDGGATWASIGNLPSIHLSNKTLGIAASGDLHFSIAADRTSPTVVYIGGDYQEANYYGTVYRGDTAGTWTALTSSGAPHAGSREIVFDAAGNLLQTDDGGIYRRTNPQDTGAWSSLNGNLQLAEFVDVAYDARTNTIVGSAAGLGTLRQNTIAGADWTSVVGTDNAVRSGASVAIDDSSVPGRSIRYSSDQYLGNFRQRVYRTDGTLESEWTPPLTVDSGKKPLDPAAITRVEMNACGATSRAVSITRNGPTALVTLNGHGLTTGDYVLITGAAQSQYNGTFQVSALDPNRFTYAVSGNPVSPATGTIHATTGMRFVLATADALYESTDGGATLTELKELGNNSIAVSGDAIVNGGYRSQGTYPRRDLLLIGSGNKIYYRHNSGDPLQGVTLTVGGTIVDIALDPFNYYNAYAVDSTGRVWKTANTGGVWTEITGDLGSLSPTARLVTSITRSSTTATVTLPGHGFTVGMMIAIGGADQSQYNGTFTITSVIDENQFRYTVTGSPASTATGTITASLPPKLQTIEFAGIEDPELDNVTTGLIVAGGVGGVFASPSYEPGKWFALNEGLPGVAVYDFDYLPGPSVTPAQDVLVAGTLGRGAWTLRGARDSGGIVITPLSGPSTESGGAATFTVRLGTRPTAPVTIDLSSTDASEGLPDVSRLTFTTDETDWKTPRTVRVVGQNDDIVDGDIWYHIITRPAESDDPAYNGLNARDFHLRNMDDDLAGFVVEAVDLETSEDGGTATFTVRLGCPARTDLGDPQGLVTLALSSGDPAEGVVTPSQLVFSAANWMIPQTVTVTGVDDAIVDGPQVYAVATGPVTSADPAYSLLDPADVSVTNLDNEYGFVFDRTAGLITTESGGTDTAAVQLSREPIAPVTISFQSTNLDEGAPTTDFLVFLTSNWNQPQTITLLGANDDVDDGDVAYQVSATPLSADTSFARVATMFLDAVNLDDDTAGFLVEPTSGLTTSESGGMAYFSVTLASRPFDSVTVTMTSTNTSEGIVTPSLVILPENWNVPHTATITGVDDDVDDIDVPYQIQLATSALDPRDALYHNAVLPNIGATNIDNDVSGFAISPTSGLVTSEKFDTATFTVRLNTIPSGNVTVGLSSSDNTEGTCTPASLVFRPSDWNVLRTVTVTGADDRDDDGDIAYKIQTGSASSSDPRYNGINPADVSLTNIDNDTAGFTVSRNTVTTSEDGTTDTFVVRLNSRPTANVTFNLSSISVLPPATVVGAMTRSGSTATATVNGHGFSGGEAVAVSGADQPEYNGVFAITVLDANRFSYTVSGAPATPATGKIVATKVVNGIVRSGSTATATMNAHGLSTGASVRIAGADQPEYNGVFTITVVDANSFTYSVPGSPASPATGTITATQVINSATRSGSTVTVTMTGHGFATGEAIAINGASQSGYNGVFTVTVVNANTFTYAIAATPSSPAAGTITAARAEATVPASVVFTPSAWSDAKTVTVTGKDDGRVDGDALYRIALTPASSDPKYNALPPGSVAGVNLAKSHPLVFSKTGGLLTGEDGTSDSFTVALREAPAGDVTITLSSSDASEGLVEGVAAPTTIEFTPVDFGPRTVTIVGQNDQLLDGDVSYQIHVTGAGSPVDLSVTNREDGDAAAVNVSPSAGLVTTESGQTATFTVSLSHQPAHDVTIGLASNDATEGVATVNRLVFTPATGQPGGWNVLQTVTVRGIDDFMDDGNISYTIATAPAGSEDPKWNAVVVPDVALSNQDDDTAGVTVRLVPAPTTPGITVSRTTVTTSEYGTTDTFSVKLETRPTAHVTIGLSSSQPAEAGLSTAALVFHATNWNTPQTVTVTGQDDSVADGDKTFQVTFAPAVSADPAYNARTPAAIQGVNQGKDAPGFIFSRTGGMTTSETGATSTFTVRLNAIPAGNVTIAFSSSDATEGAVSPAALVFNSINYATAQTVTVTGLADAELDGPVAYRVQTGPVTGDDPRFTNPVDLSVTNLDATRLTTTEAGGKAYFTVVLNAQPLGNSVSISTINSMDPTEGEVFPTNMVFSKDNWHVPQTVTITGKNDDQIDGNINYTIGTSGTNSDAADYVGVSVDDVLVVNLDNDVAKVFFSATTGLFTREPADDPQNKTTFTAWLGSKPGSNVTFTLTSKDTTEGTISASQLVFTSANWAAPQTVTITGVDDDVADGDTLYLIETSKCSSNDFDYKNLEVDDLQVTNRDDEVLGIVVGAPTPAHTMEPGSSARFTVRPGSKPTGNVTIGFTSSDTSEGIAYRAVESIVRLGSTATVTMRGHGLASNVSVRIAGAEQAEYNGVFTITRIDDNTFSYPVSGLPASPAGGAISACRILGGITAAGSTATVTMSGHGYSDGSTVFIAGAVQPQYNGVFTITLVDADTFRYTMSGTPSSPATGTIVDATARVAFTPDNWRTERTITVMGLDDRIDDGDVAYVVQGQASGADYDGLRAPDVDLVNEDDGDAWGIVVHPTSGLITTQSGDPTSFTVVLSSEPTANVEIPLALSNPAAATLSSSRLVFTAGNWSTPQTVIVSGRDLHLPYTDTSFEVVVQPAVSADPVYQGKDGDDVEVTLVNYAPEANDDSYNAEFNQTLVVPAKGVLLNDVHADSGLLTLQLVTPPPVGTLTLNADGGFTYVPEPNFGGDVRFTYRLTDPQGAADTAEVTLWIGTPTKRMTVTLPPKLWEGDPGSTPQGRITLTVPDAAPVRVYLIAKDLPADRDEARVPAFVDIPAGAGYADFPITVVDDNAQDGAQPVLVIAGADGYWSAQASMEIGDNELGRYAVSSIASPQTAAEPFLVQVWALEINDEQIPCYSGALNVTGWSGGVQVPVSFSALPFENGLTTVSVSVHAVVNDLVLTFSDNLGHDTDSQAFDVVSGPAVTFGWDPIAGTNVLDVPIPVKITTLDGNGYQATDYTSPAGIKAWVDTGASSSVVITKISDKTAWDYLELQNVSDHQVNTLGWQLVLNDPSRGVNAVYAPRNLSDAIAMTPGEVIALSDNPADADLADDDYYLGRTVTNITRSGSTATVKAANHGYFTGDVITIHGADQPQYNGVFTVTVVDPATFTYTVTGSPASPATGAVTCGQNVTWGQATGKGWAMLLDSAYSVVDFVAWGYSAAELGQVEVPVGNGMGVKVGSSWIRDGVPYSQVVASTVTSLTRAGALATVTVNNHQFYTGMRVTISGAHEPEYNGSFIVTVVDANTFTYMLSGTPATTATGTIVAAVGSTLERVGNRDQDYAGDFQWSPLRAVSPQQNADLQWPFLAQRRHPILVAPATTGTFAGGAWQGYVTISEEAEGIYLEVTGAGLAPGRSDTFRVEKAGITDRAHAPGVMDPATSIFYMKMTNQGGSADCMFGYGAPGQGWIPLSGDWNGDGTDTVGLYDPATSLFYLTNSPTGGMADIMFGFGAGGQGWVPVAGDWNGDGIDTVGLYDPRWATFYLTNKNQTGFADAAFGFGEWSSGWRPIAGDWNGDGVDTIGLYIPSSSVFLLRNQNTSGMAELAVAFGEGGSGWRPVPGDWDGDGRDTIGVYNPASGIFYQRNSNTSGYAEMVYGYGEPNKGWLPLAGDWNGTQALNAAAPASTLAAASLAEAQLAPVVAAAIADWGSLGLEPAVAQRLASIQFLVVDLPGTELGRAAEDRVYLDRNAAGHGWFVDATPEESEEFAGQGDLQAVDPAALERIDLLSVVAHELGHVAGLEHLESGLMEARLPAGVRRLPALTERDALFAAGLLGDEG